MVCMQLPQWLARFNRHVTNPIQRLWAGWAPTMGILEHTGRRSGKQYRTPLNVFPTRDGVAIMLSYGPDRDWLKNLASSGQGRIKQYGRTFSVGDPHVLPKADAAQSITGWTRALFRVAPFEQVVLLKRI